MVHGSSFIVFSRNGLALVLVLWAVTILSVLALEFSFAMRTEIQITKRYKEEIECYAIAEGGIQRAITELIYRHDPRIQQKRRALNPEQTPPEQAEWVPDGRPYRLTFSRGTSVVRIMSEAGKVNINTVSESLLRKIVTQLGLEGELRDVVVDSILDWRDPNDFYRANGAENDYYLSLPNPYYCKNGNLDSIEELLLIRGITPEIYHGKKGGPVDTATGGSQVGLKHIFSIYASGEQVEINSATPLVMRVVFGIPKEVAEQVEKARREKPFESQRDLLSRVPELSPFMGDIGRFIVYRSALPYYSIESSAWLNDSPHLQGVKVIVKIDPREKEGYKMVQWVDRIMDRSLPDKED